MLKKYIYLLIIILFLVGVCIWEDLSVNIYLQEIDDAVAEIQALVADKDAINSYDILMTVENLEEMWIKNENNLCILVNHKDIEDIGMEIARLKSTIATNQIEDFNASLSLVRFFTETYHHVMGTSIQNLL